MRGAQLNFWFKGENVEVDNKLGAVLKKKFGTMNLLLVDDMTSNIRNFKFLLEDMGFDPNKILTATNGIKALSQMTKIKPNFIITDWNMPMMDGLTFVKKVRSIDAGKNILILMITAELDKDMNQVEPYVNSFLQKPYTMATVEKVILSLIGRKILEAAKK